MLQIDRLKKDLRKAKRQVTCLAGISNETKSLVMNGVKPIWNAQKQCTVNGDIVSMSYETHRALLLLYRFNNNNPSETNETDCDPLDFACLM